MHLRAFLIVPLLALVAQSLVPAPSRSAMAAGPDPGTALVVIGIGAKGAPPAGHALTSVEMTWRQYDTATTRLVSGGHQLSTRTDCPEAGCRAGVVHYAVHRVKPGDYALYSQRQTTRSKVGPEGATTSFVGTSSGKQALMASQATFRFPDDAAVDLAGAPTPRLSLRDGEVLFVGSYLFDPWFRPDGAAPDIRYAGRLAAIEWNHREAARARAAHGGTGPTMTARRPTIPTRISGTADLTPQFRAFLRRVMTAGQIEALTELAMAEPAPPTVAPRPHPPSETSGMVIEASSRQVALHGVGPVLRAMWKDRVAVPARVLYETSTPHAGPGPAGAWWVRLTAFHEARQAWFAARALRLRFPRELAGLRARVASARWGHGGPYRLYFIGIPNQFAAEVLCASFWQRRLSCEVPDARADSR